MTGAKFLMIGYSNDNLSEIQVNVSSFLGVRIPVVFLKHSNVEYLSDVAHSVSKNHIALSITHQRDQIASDDKDKLLVFMSSQPYTNPVIDFLVELGKYQHVLSKRKVELVFSVGYCYRCREEGYMKREGRCLGGGKYCTVNAGFKTNELVKETIRLICIRNHFKTEKLVKYLGFLKEMFEESILDINNIKASEERQLRNLGLKAMNMADIRANIVDQCYKDSFLKRDNKQGVVTVHNVDEEMDDNVLLQKEQQRYISLFFNFSDILKSLSIIHFL